VFFFFLAALKNDNADDSGEESEDLDEEAKLIRRTKAEAKDVASRNPVEKQPTGRVVGVIKRNWRAYVHTPCAFFVLYHPDPTNCIIQLCVPHRPDLSLFIHPFHFEPTNSLCDTARPAASTYPHANSSSPILD